MNTKKLLLAACAALFASVGAFAIDAPGGLTASNGTSSEKIEISWNEVEGADSYILTRNGTGVNASGRAEWTVTGTSFVDATAVAGLPWLYRVQAVSGSATSGYSSYAQGYRLVALSTEGQCVVVPSAARSTSAVAMGTISVKCNTSWTAKPATDEDAWILPDSSTAFGDGDGVLRIGAEANTTGALRRGRVQIASRGTNVFFTVIQGSAGGTDETPADALDAYVRLEGEDPVARPVTLMQDFASGFAIAPSGLGTTCLRTGPMSAGELAAVCVRVEGEGQLVFSWKKASGSDSGDAYEVYANDAGPTLEGATLKATCSSEEWTEVKFALLGNGPHFVIWKHAKAGAGAGGGFLDNVQFLGLPVSLEISVNSTLLQRDGSNSVQTVLTDTFGQRSVVHPDWETKHADVTLWSSGQHFNIASGAPADVDWIRSAQHPTHMVTEVFDLRAVYSVDLGNGQTRTVRSEPVTITDVPPLCYALLHAYSNDTFRVSGSWRSEALDEAHDRADGYFAAQHDGGALLLHDGIDCAAVADVGDEDVPDEMSLVMEPTLLLFNSFFENPAADSRIELYVNDETEPRHVIVGTDCTGDWTRQEVHFEAEPEPFTLRFRFCRGEGEGTRAYVDRLVPFTSIDPVENFRARFSYDSRLVLAWDSDGYDSYEVVVHTDGGDIVWATDEGSLEIETLPAGTYDFTITPVRETTDFLDRPMTLRGQSSTLTATVSDQQGVGIYDAPGLTFETGLANEWFVVRDDDGNILPSLKDGGTGIGLQSAPIGVDTNSTLRARAVGPGRIDFRYLGSCSFDGRFKLKLNGELVEEIEDTREYSSYYGQNVYVWRDYSLELPYGTNTVEWVYEKPWTSYEGELPLGCDDCCRISEVKFVPYAFTGESRIAGQSYIAAGAAPGVFTFEADYRDDADCLRTYAVPLDESAWSCESSDPFSAQSVASEVLSDGTLGVTVADDLMFTGYVVISAETEIDGEVQSDTVYSIVKQVTVEDALNGEGTDLAYTVMHPDTWKVTLEESPPNGKGMCLEAAASRSTEGWSSRVFCATVTGRGKLSFWWKKASNSSMSGRIYFSVDKEIKEELSDGGTGWQQVEVNFDDDRPHALSWEFYDVYDEEDDKIYVGDVRWEFASTDRTFVEAFIEGPDVIESVGDKGIGYMAWLVYRTGDEQVTNPCYNAVWDANGAVDQWGEEIPRQKVDCLTLNLRNTSETNETIRLSLDVAVDGGTYAVEKEVTIAPYIDPLKAISDGALPLRLQEFNANGFVGQTNVVHVGKSALKSEGEWPMAEIVVIGPGRLTFDYKIDSSGKGASMVVEEEWVEVDRIGSQTDWTTYELEIKDNSEGEPGQYHYVTIRFETEDPGICACYLDNCTWTSTMAPVPLKTGLGLDGTDAIVTAGGSALWESFPNGQGGYRAYYSCTNGGTSASVSMQVRGEGNGSFCYMLDATGGTITFKVDGETVETFSPNGDPWERYAEFSVTGAGDHTLEWVAEGFTTADLVALCWFSWEGEYPVPDEPPKIATDDGVPYAWLVQYGIEQGPDRWETAQNLRAANGVNTVRECWLLGLNPTNESSKFTAFIEMVDGEPVVTWSPDRSDEPNPPVTYTVEGKAALDDGEDWAPKTGEHKFFRVKVTEVK